MWRSTKPTSAPFNTRKGKMSILYSTQLSQPFPRLTLFRLASSMARQLME